MFRLPHDLKLARVFVYRMLVIGTTVSIGGLGERSKITVSLSELVGLDSMGEAEPGRLVECVVEVGGLGSEVGTNKFSSATGAVNISSGDCR